MASDVNSLQELAEDVLLVARNCLATTDAGEPATFYVGPVLPAYDCCPALIVSVALLTEEATSPLAITDTGRRASFGRVNLVTFLITALRCAAKVQNDGSVLTADMEAASTEVNQDAWALWEGFYHAVGNGTFVGRCSDVHFDRGQAIREQGGCVGWEFALRAQLDGIPNPGPGT